MRFTEPEINHKSYCVNRERSVLKYLRNQQKRAIDYFIWLIISTHQIHWIDGAAYTWRKIFQFFHSMTY
jgi:hypothetical protein